MKRLQFPVFVNKCCIDLLPLLGCVHKVVTFRLTAPQGCFSLLSSDRRADRKRIETSNLEVLVMNIQGKTALVTGANRGIGRAIALELAQQGVQTPVVAGTRSPALSCRG